MFDLCHVREYKYLLMKSNNTNILITGANGFIGSHLAEFFTKKNLMYFHLIDTIYKIILDGLKIVQIKIR